MLSPIAKKVQQLQLGYVARTGRMPVKLPASDVFCREIEEHETQMSPIIVQINREFAARHNCRVSLRRTAFYVTGRDAITCPHGIKPKYKCMKCRDDYARTQIMTVREVKRRIMRTVAFSILTGDSK